MTDEINLATAYMDPDEALVSVGRAVHLAEHVSRITHALATEVQRLRLQRSTVLALVELAETGTGSVSTDKLRRAIEAEKEES